MAMYVADRASRFAFVTFGVVVFCGISSAQVFNGVQINTDMSGANIVGDAANEPSFAISMTDPNVLVAGWRQFATINSSFRKAGYAFSHDGGLTWTNGGILVDPPGTNNPNQTDPALAADRFGNIFYNSMLFGSADGQTVYKSTDGGVSWEDGVFIYTRGTDKNWYAIDNRASGLGAGNHYAIWQLSGRFARSTDQAQTWDTWSNGASIYAFIETDPQGTVHTAWWGGSGIQYQRSMDAKDPSKTPTFPLHASIPVGDLPWQLPVNPAGAAGTITIESPKAGEPNEGVLYLMCSAVRQNDVCDVMFSKSLDNGVTWSTPLRVNDDSNHSDYNWMAVMSLAPGGRLDAVWYDTRDDPGHFLSKLYYTCSYDGGDTWIPDRAISETFDSTVGWPVQRKIGDYFQCLSDGGGTNIVYAATFNGEQDVYYLRHHPIELSVSPLIAGKVATASALYGRPNSQSYLIYSLDGIGRTNVSQLNVILDIVNPKLATRGKKSDSTGAVSWDVLVPAGAKGLDVWLEVAQMENGSNVVMQRVQ